MSVRQNNRAARIKIFEIDTKNIDPSATVNFPN